MARRDDDGPRHPRTKPFAPRAAVKRADGVWWRTLAYCGGCGKRIGVTARATWCRVKIRLPEFRRNAICGPCALAGWEG